MMAREIDESKEIYDDFYDRYSRVFLLLNLQVEFDVIIFIENDITRVRTIIKKLNGVLHESLLPDGAIDYVEYIRANDAQKVFITKRDFVELLDSYFVTGVIIINDYQHLCERIDESLLEAVIEHYHDLRHPTLGKIIQVEINTAGKTLVDKMPLTAGLFEQLNAVSALKYESEVVRSKLIVVSDALINLLTLDILFEDPVIKTDYKTVRKLLEVSTQENILIGTNKFFHGFIDMENFIYQLKGNSSHCLEQVYLVHLKGILIWDMYRYEHKTQAFLPYISSNMTNISYPKQKINKTAFIKNISSVFAEYNADALWTITRHAIEQKHGTMLVISNGAEKESERLKKCAIKINKVDLAKSEIMKSISSIDGAIMCDPQGYCYSMGVILDGIHSEDTGESISRGARFNSAHRYKHNSKYECLIVIVSEDGDVDLV